MGLWLGLVLGFQSNLVGLVLVFRVMVMVRVGVRVSMGFRIPVQLALGS